MTLQHSKGIALNIENVDSGVIKRHDDVRRREVQACHDSTILCNRSDTRHATSSPRRIDQVSLLEVGFVGPEHRPRTGSVQTPRCRHSRDRRQSARETMICELSVRAEKRVCPRSGGVRGYGRAHIRESTSVIVLHAEVLPSHVVAEEVSPSAGNLGRPREDFRVVDE